MAGCLTRMLGQSSASSGARYWRINITQNNGHATLTCVGELEFASSPGGANLVSGGTALSGGSGADVGGRTAIEAFNGRATGLWERSSPTNTYLGYDFGSPVNVVEIRIEASTVSNRVGAEPRNFTIDSSPDGSNWTTVFTCTAYDWQYPWVRTFPEVPATGEHHRWRINVASANGGTPVRIEELELRATAGGADGTPVLSSMTPTSTAVPLASSFVGGREPYFAFNGVTVGTDYWASNTGTSGWVGISMSYLLKVDEISMTSTSDPTRSPNTFTLEWSDDGGSSWTVQKSWSGITWTAAETKVLTAL